MAQTVRRWADRGTEPWANGLGITHPLANGGGDGWRVSIAEIAGDAEFSRLPDIHRQFVCLGPTPIRLYVEDQPRDVAVGDITLFSGGSQVRCEVEQPSLALNVMSRIGTPALSVQLLDLRAGGHVALPFVPRGLVVLLAGTAQLTTAAGAVELTRFDALDCHDTAVQLAGVGRAAFIVL